jgi:hypothetical protein
MKFKRKNWEMHVTFIVDFHIQFTIHETPKIHPNPLALHITFTILYIYCWILIIFSFIILSMKVKKLKLNTLGMVAKMIMLIMLVTTYIHMPPNCVYLRSHHISFVIALQHLFVMFNPCHILTSHSHIKLLAFPFLF